MILLDRVKINIIFMQPFVQNTLGQFVEKLINRDLLYFLAHVIQQLLS